MEKTKKQEQKKATTTTRTTIAITQTAIATAQKEAKLFHFQKTSKKRATPALYGGKVGVAMGCDSDFATM